jgi:hypothetical protein
MIPCGGIGHHLGLWDAAGGVDSPDGDVGAASKRIPAWRLVAGVALFMAAMTAYYAWLTAGRA